MCVAGSGRGRERRPPHTGKWWREGEAEAANEGREMTVIQPLLPYNLKQCVMELSSPSYYLPLPASLPPSLPKKSAAAVAALAASSHVYVIDNCFHLESRK